jgi:hypothetical protein
MKVVINEKAGGFGLSPEAVKLFLNLKGTPCFLYLDTGNRRPRYERINEEDIQKYNDEKISICTVDLGEALDDNLKNRANIYTSEFDRHRVDRTDSDLIKTIETLGEKANGKLCILKIIEIPDDVKFTIEQDEYGIESIEEVHRSWY